MNFLLFSIHVRFHACYELTEIQLVLSALPRSLTQRHSCEIAMTSYRSYAPIPIHSPMADEQLMTSDLTR